MFIQLTRAESGTTVDVNIHHIVSYENVFDLNAKDWRSEDWRSESKALNRQFTERAKAMAAEDLKQPHIYKDALEALEEQVKASRLLSSMSATPLSDESRERMLLRRRTALREQDLEVEHSRHHRELDEKYKAIWRKKSPRCGVQTIKRHFEVRESQEDIRLLIARARR